VHEHTFGEMNCNDEEVRVWDLLSGTCTQSERHGKNLIEFAFVIVSSFFIVISSGTAAETRKWSCDPSTVTTRERHGRLACYTGQKEKGGNRIPVLSL
jgi:hypothetical protein